jgi:hypothetical protein
LPVYQQTTDRAEADQGSHGWHTGLCSDCPPVGYPHDRTRCDECPRATSIQFAGSELDPSRGATSACMGEPQATPAGCEMPWQRPAVALHHSSTFVADASLSPQIVAGAKSGISDAGGVIAPCLVSNRRELDSFSACSRNLSNLLTLRTEQTAYGAVLTQGTHGWPTGVQG